METIKHVSWLTGAILAAGIAQSAVAVTINDGYVGSDGGTYGDVVGADSQFQITSMDVTYAGSELTVSVNTNFAGTAGTNFFGQTVGGTGIGYGDLFLSTDGWDPFGTAPYSGDNAGNGEIWEYALSIDGDRFESGFTDTNDLTNSAGGTLSLYRLHTDATGYVNDDGALLSDDFMSTSTNNYRNGQEVAVDRDGGFATDVTVTDGTWSVVNGAIVFNIDLTGTGLDSTSFSGFHWAMTCANDTIEGAPAPYILLIMATGLLGVGASTMLRKRKAA